jgi:hypothetical protein
MKKTNLMIVCAMVAIFQFAQTTFAQTKKQTLTVLNLDTKGLPLDPAQMGNLVRLEVEKINKFQVTDRYEIISIAEAKKLNLANCYGKNCLIEVGKQIPSDYMLSGSVELYGQVIIYTLRLINVKEESVEQTVVQEFLNLPLELQSMTSVMVAKMFNRPQDDVLFTRLTKKFDFESSTNNPNVNKLDLQGPRFGYTFIFGQHATRLRQPTRVGGYEATPAFFQFGYQFEKQYLNEGKFQALFEFIPMISGVDQQLIIPSVAFLNGFRNNVSGWEIAIGPTISYGTYRNLGEYKGEYLTREELNARGLQEGVDYDIRRTMDSRGTGGLSSALVIAVGKSFKSGKMNIPINFWTTIPANESFRVGISVGYNTKK